MFQRPHNLACQLQITKATVPRAPKLMRILLAGAFGGLEPYRVRDVSDVLTTFLRVRHLLVCKPTTAHISTAVLLPHTYEISQ